ncbi:hypothetical protein EON79_07610 [bacterium]|nr:MAG: hypothetical protein EON79_07610 [bacterium]
MVAATASAQNIPLWWSRSTGTNDASDQTVSTAFDANNNLYTLYRINNGGNIDVRVTKYTHTGAVRWSRTLDLSSADVPKQMALDAAGNAVVVGSTVSGTNTNLLLAKFDAVDGTVTSRSIENPFNSAEAFIGNAVTVDPEDNSVVVGTGVVQTGAIRPYVFKFDSASLNEVWRSGSNVRSASFSHVVVQNGRVFAGGNLEPRESVYVGYVPRSGGSFTGYAPTDWGGPSEAMTKMIVVDDHLIWGGYSSMHPESMGRYGIHYGMFDFSAGSGDPYVEYSDDFGWEMISDIAYDPSTDQIAFQTTWQEESAVWFMTLDPANLGFVYGNYFSRYESAGYGVGIVPVTGGKFASFSANSADVENPEMSVTLIDPIQGEISRTRMAPGTIEMTREGVPVSLHWPVSSRGRALAGGGASLLGATISSLSYISSPANDAKRLKEDTTLTFNVLHNDNGFGEKSAVLLENVSHGTLTLDANGVATYIPAPNWYGTDGFSYTLFVNGNNEGTRTVTYNVLSVIDPPVAVDDNVGAIASNGAVVLSLLANDENAEGPSKPLRYLSVTQPSNGTVSLANNKTTLKIKAKAGQAGKPFTFTYTIQNGTGTTSTATVTGTFAR